MQVFKLYFKILRKYKGSIIMYALIFLVVIAAVIVPQTKKNNRENYAQKKSNFAIFDYDDSELSHKVTEYLSKRHTQVAIVSDDLETIQDELYNVNVDCVIRIQKGFEASFLEGNNAEKNLEIYEVPNEVGALLLKQCLNSYLTVTDTYISAGFSANEAAKKAEEASAVSVDVTFADEAGSEEKPVQTYFAYLSWVFIAMSVESLAIVLLAINKKEIKNRIECSSYRFVRMNLEILLGVLLTGAVICLMFVAVACGLFSEDMFSVRGILYALNSFCMMSVALSITFLVSRLTSNRQAISMFSNVAGLSMGFLCGVFVPIEILSESVIRVAHFLPAYWYVKAINAIASLKTSEIANVASYMGIQLLFAAALVCVAMLIARKQTGKGAVVSG